MLQSAFYPTDIVKAIQEAFNQTDETFLEKVSKLGFTKLLLQNADL